MTLKLIVKQDVCFRLSLVFWFMWCNVCNVATRVQCVGIVSDGFITRFNAESTGERIFNFFSAKLCQEYSFFYSCSNTILLPVILWTLV